AEPAAQTNDAPRQRGVGYAPAGDVHLVNALVADVAVAEIPEPVPVVMDQVGVERLLRCRAEPEIKVHLGGWGGCLFGADAAAGLVAQAAGHQQLAELAGLDDLRHLGLCLAAAAL